MEKDSTSSHLTHYPTHHHTTTHPLTVIQPPSSPLPTPMFTLPQNATYCVTGGTSGIGLEVARLLLLSAPPCRVLIVARRSRELEMTVAMLAQECDAEDRVLGVPADVSTPPGRAAVSRAVEEAFGGKLTGLVNNVGCNVRKAALEQTGGEYDAMVATNMSSTYFLSKLLSPFLFERARGDIANGSVVVNVSSMAGVYSSGTGAVYGMTKAAVNSLTRSLACEWSKGGGTTENYRRFSFSLR
ncbi:hypothetical protein TrRE_jg6006 [Triparma retinervis]|uniref:Uncharacterized protein n=1 Tax=Triparma retinervis TaxID=2557542 RepID=A0A9W7CFB6_9STRA|nr:hypothetical protein TrRE_jg6006 [Triparma retinervis]